MKRRALALLTSLLLVYLVPGSAVAATADLDQSTAYGPGHDFGGAVQLAQTFTAGKTGTLTSVDLDMRGSGSVTVTLKGATNGILDHNVVPIGAALATATASVTTASMGWVKFSFASPYAITSGNFYSIVFSPGVASVGGSSTNYGGGRALIYWSTSWVTVASKYGSGGAADWAFRTWVKAAAPKATPTLKATPTAPKKTPTAPKATPTATHSVPATATLTPTNAPTASPTAVAATTAPAATATPVSSLGSGSASGSSSGGSGDSTMLLVIGGIVVLGLLLGGLWFLVVRLRGQAKS
jgi:hypothetical protein